jgi:hypothetical protein
LPTLSGILAPTADSASGSFFRQVPRLPVTPAVGLTSQEKFSSWIITWEQRDNEKEHFGDK